MNGPLRWMKWAVVASNVLVLVVVVGLVLLARSSDRADQRQIVENQRLALANCERAVRVRAAMLSFHEEITRRYALLGHLDLAESRGIALDRLREEFALIPPCPSP